MVVWLAPIEDHANIRRASGCTASSLCRIAWTPCLKQPYPSGAPTGWALCEAAHTVAILKPINPTSVSVQATPTYNVPII